MEENLGFRITIFLPNGNPNGLKLIRKSNWDGLGIVCPRHCYAKEKGRVEFERSGVYMLVGKTEEENVIYIGETDNVRERLNTHYAEKDFWQHAVIFMRQGDYPLNKAEVRYLEAALLDKANANKRYAIENNTQPKLTASMSDEEKEIMKVYLNEMLSLLPIIGVNAFEKISFKKRADETIYSYKGNGFDATGYEVKTGNDFVVQKDSVACKDVKNSIPPSSKKKREKLMEEGVLIEKDNRLVFSEDYTFGSPSGAAEVIYGGATSGPKSWKDGNNSTLEENRNREIGQT